jgi:hypothetical protein
LYSKDAYTQQLLADIKEKEDIKNGKIKSW